MVLHAKPGWNRKGMPESAEERHNRELIELLNELRVALPGVQVLFAFLLAVPFANGFPKLSSTGRDLYFAAFIATARLKSPAIVSVFEMMSMRSLSCCRQRNR